MSETPQSPAKRPLEPLFVLLRDAIPNAGLSWTLLVEAYQVLFAGAFCLEHCLAALADASPSTTERDYLSRVAPRLPALHLEPHQSRETQQDHSLWVAGFFVTRAQHSVVAAVDKSINAVLTCGRPYGERKLREYYSFYADFAARMEMLVTLSVHDSESRLKYLALELEAAFKARSGSEVPYRKFDGYNENVLPHVFAESNRHYDIAKWSRSMLSTAAECVANCVDVTNEWKHLPGPSARWKDADESRRVLLSHAWIGTCLAQVLTTEFFRYCVKRLDAASHNTPVQSTAEKRGG